MLQNPPALVVNTPGLPPMYHHEHVPQMVQSALIPLRLCVSYESGLMSDSLGTRRADAWTIPTDGLFVRSSIFIQYVLLLKHQQRSFERFDGVILSSTEAYEQEAVDHITQWQNGCCRIRINLQARVVWLSRHLVRV